MDAELFLFLADQNPRVPFDYQSRDSLLAFSGLRVDVNGTARRPAPPLVIQP